ncbi:TrmB family transcriptional regulator [Candidatus Bathyarchaeota archaeon]|nr:TrmB family transcriptional regulator [Candidatus Bathyarchaeota archaeon]
MVEISEKEVRDKILFQLKELGLSTYEAVTYLTLLAHPNISASTLCKETGIPDSKIYYGLNGLSKKGMIIVQRGVPKIYAALHPKEAIGNLKNQLVETLNEKMEKADTLISLLSPIYESAEKPQEIELAYIIRGQGNIIRKMNDLIKSAKKEITILISYPSILRSVKTSLSNVKQRKVKLNLAATEEVLKKENLTKFGLVKLLRCPCTMLIVDMKTLLNVSSWTGENSRAILTQDLGLVTVSKEYYHNPQCCVEIDR